MNHRFLTRCAAAAALFTTLAVQAGECPADKVAANALAGAAMAPVGVTDTELAWIDLGQENVKLSQRRLRLRHMTIAPGGVVPLHSHADRPALIYIISGKMTEYASNCSVPIVHTAGDVARETSQTAHWWKNTGSKTAVLISADILHDQTDQNM